MQQCKGIYIGKIVISNQVKIKLKSKSMDYVDVLSPQVVTLSPTLQWPRNVFYIMDVLWQAAIGLKRHTST